MFRALLWVTVAVLISAGLLDGSQPASDPVPTVASASVDVDLSPYHSIEALPVRDGWRPQQTPARDYWR